VGGGAGVVTLPGTKPGFTSGPPAGFCIVGGGVGGFVVGSVWGGVGAGVGGSGG
jgi:hypothetical protein